MVSEHLFDRACADLHEMHIRAEAAEAELARVKASGIESMRRAESAEKERDANEHIINDVLRALYGDADGDVSDLAHDIAQLRAERDHFAERSKMVEHENKRLKEALERIVNLDPSAGCEEAIAAVKDIENAIAQCGECKYAKEVNWPTSGLCSKHYGPYHSRVDRLAYLREYNRMWKPLEIAREALNGGGHE